jgi:transcriptional regulator with XRE-family HTH domain
MEMAPTAALPPAPAIRRFRYGPTAEQRNHRKQVLKEARKNAHLTQRKFAAKIGRAYPYVARREVGFDYLTVDDVIAWATGSDMDPVVLFAKLIQSPERAELQAEENHAPPET